MGESKMQFLLNAVGNLPAINMAINTVTGEGVFPVAAFGVPDLARSAVSLYTAKKIGAPVLVLTETEAEARHMATDVASLGGTAAVYPSRDFNFLNTLGTSKEYEHQRIAALWKFLNGEVDVLFTDIEAFTQKAISPAALKNSAITLTAGGELNLARLTKTLINMGYDNTEQVDGAGQFSVRGGIVDIFSPASDRPVRIELWGDEIDSIAFFDPADQRRNENIDEVTVLPASEFFADTETLVTCLKDAIATKKISGSKPTALVNGDIDILLGGGTVSADKYMHLLKNPAVFLSEYFKDSVLIISENRNVMSRLKGLDQSRLTLAEDLVEQGIITKKTPPLFSGKHELEEFITTTKTIYLDSFVGSSHLVAPKGIYTANIQQLTPWGGSMDVLLDDIRPAIKAKKTVVILAGSQKGADILINQLNQNGIKASLMDANDIIAGLGVFVLPFSLSAGLELADQNMLVIAHKPLNLSAKPRKKRNKGDSFNSLDEL